MRPARNPFADGPLPANALRDRDIAFFQEGGASVFALAGYCADPHEIQRPFSTPMQLGFRVRRERVCFSRRGRFSFEADLRGEPDDAVPAYVLPAIEAGAIVDEVAWHPRSGRIATHDGRAGLLGADLIESSTKDEPVRLLADPRAWLAAWRQGVVVVDEALARPVLREARCPLQVETVTQGEALEAMLSKVRMPRIVVPSASVTRAAA